MLTFSIVAGLAIANYDVIKTLKWLGCEIETIVSDVNLIKETAINEMREEVNKLKKKLSLVHAYGEAAKMSFYGEKTISVGKGTLRGSEVKWCEGYIGAYGAHIDKKLSM